MKKFGKIVGVVCAVATLATLSAGLTACGGGGEAAEINNTYVVSQSSDNAYGGADYSVYSLNLMSDGSYELVKTTYTLGYGMNLGTYSYQIFGTYTAGASADGYTAYTLSEATRVIVNAYSTMGGFDIHVDSATSTYPTELPAKVQGEQNMAQSADDVIDEYGAQTTVYISATGNILALTNPNA